MSITLFFVLGTLYFVLYQRLPVSTGLPPFLRGLVSAAPAELRVRNAEELRERGGSFRREIAVGAQMGLDYLGRRLLRIIDHGRRRFGLSLAAAENALHRHVEPSGQ